jgi:alpha-L-fucosidase 2
MPIGNGTLGALVYGAVAAEKVILNHENLFLPVFADRPVPVMHQHVPTLREMIASGKFVEAQRFWYEILEEHGACNEWVDPFHPAGQLLHHHESNDRFTGYERELNFASGMTTTSWRSGDAEFCRQAFVSRPAGVMVLRFSAGGTRSSGSICLGPCEQERHETGALLMQSKLKDGPGTTGENYVRYSHDNDYMGGQPGSGGRSARSVWLRMQGEYHGENRTGEKFGVVLKIASVGGELAIDDTCCRYLDSNECVALAGVFSPAQAGGMEELCRQIDAVGTDFDSLLADHECTHGELYRRVVFSLPGGEKTLVRQTDREALADAYASGAKNVLVEKMFNFSRYCLISSSGNMPPNLQGVWSGTWTPPWYGGYTLDENIQMNLWQALPGGIPEFCHPYFDFLERQFPDWRENARNLYDASGMVAPVNSTTNGRSFNVLPTYPWHFWVSGPGWLAALWYDYWLFTGDREFLRDRAWPLYLEIIEFYEDFLQIDEDGKYLFSPSFSPENAPGNGECFTTRNATMDIAVAREVLKNAIAISEELGELTAQIPQWRGMLEKLPDYSVNADGALCEWLHADHTDNYQHRHLSHVYPVFPGSECSKRFEPELFAACAEAVRQRLRAGSGAQVSWSVVHLANTFARLGWGEEALECLDDCLRFYAGENFFFHIHDWRGSGVVGDSLRSVGQTPFQIDGVLGFGAAVMEMLLFSHREYIELLPALPASWPSGRISGLRARGHFSVSLRWDDGVLAEALITAARTCRHTVYYRQEKRVIDFTAGETYTFKP